MRMKLEFYDAAEIIDFYDKLQQIVLVRNVQLDPVYLLIKTTHDTAQFLY